jgi:hypothetical protein
MLAVTFSVSALASENVTLKPEPLGLSGFHKTTSLGLGLALA